MPFICLARADIPDGTLQVLDLFPNESLRSDLDPPGQTKYLNRVLNPTVPNNGAGLVASDTDGLRAYLVDRVEPAGGSWTVANQIAVSAGLLARLDAGQALTLSDIDTVIQVTFGASDLDGAGSNSTGTVLELLSVLAGRAYRIPTGAQKLTGAAWQAPQAGSFTRDNVVFDTQMLQGEIRPTTPWVRHPNAGITTGGDTEQVEIKPIRATVDGSSFQQSLLNGHLAVMQSGTVTLFPDNDVAPFQPWTYQKAAGFITQVDNARLVTVYNDDGSLA